MGLIRVYLATFHGYRVLRHLHRMGVWELELKSSGSVETRGFISFPKNTIPNPYPSILVVRKRITHFAKSSPSQRVHMYNY